MYMKCAVVLAFVAFSAATLVWNKNILVKQDVDKIILADDQGKFVHFHLDRFDGLKGLKTIDILIEVNGMVKKFTIVDDIDTFGKRQSDTLRYIFRQFNGILDKESFELLMTVVAKHVQTGELHKFFFDTLKVLYTQDIVDINTLDLLFQKDYLLEDEIQKDMLYQTLLEKTTPYNRYDMLIRNDEPKYFDLDKVNFNKMVYFKNMMQNGVQNKEFEIEMLLENMNEIEKETLLKKLLLKDNFETSMKYGLYNKNDFNKEFEIEMLVENMNKIEKAHLLKKMLLKDLQKEMYFQGKIQTIPRVIEVGQDYQTEKFLNPEFVGMNKMYVDRRVLGDKTYGLTFNEDKKIRDLTLRKVLFGIPEDRRTRFIKDQRFFDVTGNQMLRGDDFLNKDLTFNRLTTQKPLFWWKMGQTGRQQFMRDDVRHFDRVTPYMYDQDVIVSGMPVMRKIQYLEPRQEKFNILY